jgi:hypothetical protein
VPRDFIVPVSRLTPLQREAWLFATIVEPTDIRARQRLIEVEERLFADPVVAQLDPRIGWAQKIHRKAVNVIELRLICGEAGCAFLDDGVVRTLRRELPDARGQGGINELRADGVTVGPLSVDAMCLWGSRKQAERAGRSPNKTSPQYFRQHVWAPTKPVLHLAVVVQRSSRNMRPGPVMKPLGAAALSEMFSDLAATKDLFAVAEQHRHALLDVAQTGAFQLEESDTVRLIAA